MKRKNILSFQQQSFLPGFFDDGQREGTGMLFLSSHSGRREGEWRRDKLHGFGNQVQGGLLLM